MADIEIIEAKYRALSDRLDEATLRIWAAVEARSLGRGGVSTVAKAIGRSRTTIYAWLAELESPPLLRTGDDGDIRPRIRAVGGGRKRLAEKDANLVSALDTLIEPTTYAGWMLPRRCAGPQKVPTGSQMNSSAKTSMLASERTATCLAKWASVCGRRARRVEERIHWHDNSYNVPEVVMDD